MAIISTRLFSRLRASVSHHCLLAHRCIEDGAACAKLRGNGVVEVHVFKIYCDDLDSVVLVIYMLVEFRSRRSRSLVSAPLQSTKKHRR